jgi:hypothetical protein
MGHRRLGKQGPGKYHPSLSRHASGDWHQCWHNTMLGHRHLGRRGAGNRSSVGIVGRVMGSITGASVGMVLGADAKVGKKIIVW